MESKYFRILLFSWPMSWAPSVLKIVPHECVCTWQHSLALHRHCLGVQHLNQSPVATQLPSESLSWSQHFYSLLSPGPGHSQLAVTDGIWAQHRSPKYRQQPPCLAPRSPLSKEARDLRVRKLPRAPTHQIKCSLESNFLDLKTYNLSHCSYHFLSCPLSAIALLLIRCNTIIAQ